MEKWILIALAAIILLVLIEEAVQWLWSQYMSNKMGDHKTPDPPKRKAALRLGISRIKSEEPPKKKSASG